jgi:hypothetical protein
MKIELTQTQFETLRAALVTAQVALENIEKDLRWQKRTFMANYRASQVRDITNALKIVAWEKIKIID